MGFLGEDDPAPELAAASAAAQAPSPPPTAHDSHVCVEYLHMISLGRLSLAMRIQLWWVPFLAPYPVPAWAHQLGGSLAGNDPSPHSWTMSAACAGSCMNGGPGSTRRLPTATGTVFCSPP